MPWRRGWAWWVGLHSFRGRFSNRSAIGQSVLCRRRRTRMSDVVKLPLPEKNFCPRASALLHPPKMTNLMHQKPTNYVSPKCCIFSQKVLSRPTICLKNSLHFSGNKVFPRIESVSSVRGKYVRASVFTFLLLPTHRGSIFSKNQFLYTASPAVGSENFLPCSHPNSFAKPGSVLLAS